MIDMTIPGNREYVTFVTLAHGLALEVNTGMKYTRAVSLIKVAQREGYRGPSNKRKALRWTVDTLLENFPNFAPSPSIVRALSE